MKTMTWQRLVLAFSLVLTVCCSLHAAKWDPTASDYSGPKGKMLYVSKLGDNSDGSSWHKAFHTIQAVLLAIPDDKGGHRVVIRPDTYEEANLYPAYRGAAGAYNLLVGDFDGKLGSGASGWVVLDLGVRAWPCGPIRRSRREIDLEDHQVRPARIRPEVRRLVGSLPVQPRALRLNLGPLGSIATSMSPVRKAGPAGT